MPGHGFHLRLKMTEINIILEALQHYSVFNEGNPMEFVALDLCRELELDAYGETTERGDNE